jgi:hypothetical protein
LRRVIAAQPNDLFCATRIYVAGYTDWARNDLAIRIAHRLGGDTSANTLPFQVVNSASTTLFAVTDGGNVVAKFLDRRSAPLPPRTSADPARRAASRPHPS